MRGAQYVTSLDLSRPEDKALFIRAVQDDIPGSDEWIGKVFSLVGYVCSPASREDELNGELQEWVRTVLVLDDRKLIACGSRGVWSSLCIFVQLQGPAPWDPPLTVRLRRRKLKVGHWHWLELVLDGGQPAGPKPPRSQT